MFRIFLVFGIILFILPDVYSQETGFSIQTDFTTGGVQKIMNKKDPYKMNWILFNDGSQYKWQTEDTAKVQFTSGDTLNNVSCLDAGIYGGIGEPVDDQQGNAVDSYINFKNNMGIKQLTIAAFVFSMINQ